MWSQKITLLFINLSLMIGIGTYLAVMSSVTNVRRALNDRSKEFLGADISFQKERGKTHKDYNQFLSHPDVKKTAWTLETLTVARHPIEDGKERIIELKAVNSQYPLIDGYKIREKNAFLKIQKEGAIVDEALLEAWDLDVVTDMSDVKPNQTLKVGEAQLPIVGALVEEPGRIQGAFTRGARVILSYESLDKTQLISEFSRYNQTLFFLLHPHSDVSETLSDFKQMNSTLNFRSSQDKTHRGALPIKNVLNWLLWISFTVLILTLFMITTTMHSFLRAKDLLLVLSEHWE